MKTYSQAREEIIGALTSTRINKRFVSRDEAERKFDERADRLPTFPSFKAGDEDLVKDEDIIPFLSDLLKPHMWASSKGGEDENISWGTDRVDPNVASIPQLVALAAQAEEDAARARSFGSVLGGAPPPVPGESFASTNQAFQSAIRPESVAPASYAATGPGAIVPAVAATPGMGVVPIREVVPGPVAKGVTGGDPLPPILRMGHAMAEMDAAAKVEIAMAVAKATKTPVAKASARPSHSVRVIKAGR
jgi:hypothetical protein